MHPNPSGGVDAFSSKNLQLLERCLTVARMCRDRQAALQMSSRRGLHQLAIDVGKRAAVDSNLDEPRSYPGSFDALAPFMEPAPGKLVGCFLERVCRQEFSLAGAVVTRVGEDRQAACFGKTLEQQRVAAELRRRAFHQRPTACGSAVA